jgi:hypothetical protein
LNSSGNFHGIPVYTSPYVEKGAVYLVGKKPEVEYLLSDSFDTVLARLDDEFLQMCGIVKNLKP